MSSSSTLQSSFYARLDADPAARAICFYDAQGKFEWISRERFFRMAAAQADRMRAAGLRAGDVCLIALPSKLPSATLLLGALTLGAVPLMIAPPALQKYNSDLLEIVKNNIKRTRARLVVHDDSLDPVKEGMVVKRGAKFLLAGDTIPETATLPRETFVAPDPNSIVAMQLTSGTTGFPRICVWKHAGVLAAIEGMAKGMGIVADDVYFNWTPLYHDMGLVNNFFLCMNLGIPMVLQNPNDFVKKPARWLRGVQATGSTVTWSPNFGYAMAAERITDEEMEGVRLDHVRQFWNAAEKIHLESVIAFRDRFKQFGVRPETLKMNFGCAENVGGATFTRPNEGFKFERVDRAIFQKKRIAKVLPDGAGDENALTFVSCGPPHPDMEMQMLSPSGKPLPEGHVGEIAMKTPSRLDHFLKNTAATKKAHFGEWLRTGDLGYMRGGDLYWVGRAKERITIRGKKFDPSDFERAMLEIEGLRKGCFAAFGIEEKAQGTERIVVLAEIVEPPTRPIEQIGHDVREQIFKKLDVTISDVVLVKTGTLTKTSSGKRRHRHFKKMFLEGKLGPFLAGGV